MRREKGTNYKYVDEYLPLISVSGIHKDRPKNAIEFIVHTKVRNQILQTITEQGIRRVRSAYPCFALQIWNKR